MSDIKSNSYGEIVLGGKKIVGALQQDGTIKYDRKAINETIQEIIAGQSGKTSGHFTTTAQVVYRYDNSRKTHHDQMYSLWKSNVLMNNRIQQLNGLVFGKGLKWIYDKNTKEIIDRFWRINRIKQKLEPICVDSQLYGEVFIGLFPQASGDVLMSMYESRQVDIDFDPSDIYRINRYIVTYKNEETGKDEQFDMMPIENYLNEIEFSNNIGSSNIVKKVRKSLRLSTTNIKGGKGVMCHIKFNNSTGEVYGTSDFYQVSDVLQDYMDFVGDRLTVHQLYGSPTFDITIDTDDPEIIEQRIDELAGFAIGSNPVHNKQEQWNMLESKNGGISPTADDKLLRGLICAGMSFPEYLLFNQSETSGDSDNTLALTKLAQSRQNAFNEAFTDIHKFVISAAGGDIHSIDEGQIIFPEIDTMSEKTKAETYILKVGANICSRRTAAINMGHNYDIEEEQIINEAETFAQLSDNSDFAGVLGGRFTSRQNNNANIENPKNGDDGTRDRQRRAKATNIQTKQIVNNNKNKY